MILENQIICIIDECVETFYGRHTAKHSVVVIENDNNKCGDFVI